MPVLAAGCNSDALNVSNAADSVLSRVQTSASWSFRDRLFSNATIYRGWIQNIKIRYAVQERNRVLIEHERLEFAGGVY